MRRICAQLTVARLDVGFRYVSCCCQTARHAGYGTRRAAMDGLFVTRQQDGYALRQYGSDELECRCVGLPSDRYASFRRCRARVRCDNACDMRQYAGRVVAGGTVCARRRLRRVCADMRASGCALHAYALMRACEYARSSVDSSTRAHARGAGPDARASYAAQLACATIWCRGCRMRAVFFRIWIVRFAHADTTPVRAVCSVR